MLDQILKNMNLFVDGRGYAGNVEDVTLPRLTLKTEDLRAGGMDASVEVDMGMEKLELSFTLTQFDREVLKLWGLAPGTLSNLTLRGAVESDTGDVEAVVVNATGKIREIDMGTWKAGERATLKVAVGLRYYRLTHGGEVLHEIDVPGMVRTIGGVDQLANTRAALGL